MGFLGGCLVRVRISTILDLKQGSLARAAVR
jgi:hypothetical protein